MDLKRAAKSLGAADLGYSDRRNKKNFVIFEVRMIHFGDSLIRIS